MTAGKNLHRTRQSARLATPGPVAQKKKPAASKSRDVPEDRGMRQMKTAHESQTFPHAHQ